MHKDFDIVKKLISEKEYSLALEQLEKLNVKDLPIEAGPVNLYFFIFLLLFNCFIFSSIILRTSLFS